ncbi:MAG TPA: PKD domain-containing protein [Bacteroidia bacterium]|jgi:PKD repeat protein|nr:PKD domain-containing protein [Bacteroidia bacterium]
MRRLKIATLCFVIGVFIISCQKQHLPAQTNASPIFYFNGLVGGSNVNLYAGVNNYYMYSSYTQNDSGIYNYTANLKEFNCISSCPPSIEFIINDYQKLGIGVTEANIAKSLDTGSYNYLLPNPTPSSLYKVFFYPTPGNKDVTISQYTWSFGDGTDTIYSVTSANVNSPIHHTYLHAGNYATSLTAKFADGSSNSLSNIVHSNNTPGNFNCNIMDTSSTTTVYFTDTPDLPGTYTYNWNFGDTGSGSTVQNPSHPYTDTLIHTVSVITTNTTYGTSDTNFLNVAAGAGITIAQSHLINYHASVPPPVIISNPLGLSDVTIIYTDASGDKYSSYDSLQPKSSSFQITSLSNYQNNESGQTTKQLHIKFDCILYDSTGKTLAIKNGDAVIAVAYK